MRDKKEFYSTLNSINGRRYAEYVKLVGDFDFARYVLKIAQVEEEGSPTLFVVRVPQIIAAFPPHLFNSPVRRTALEDLLTRKVAAGIEQLARYDASGISRRRLSIAVPRQKILPRTSLVVTEEYVEARVYVDLAANKGRIDGDSANELFFEDLPAVVNSSLIYCNLNEHEVEKFVDIMEDADQVRQLLATRGLISFVADDSLLARDGESDLPDRGGERVDVPEELALSIDVPNQGSISGLGIPSGLTLILGDDYAGRTRFVEALADGIYNHVPGDGREFVVSVPDAVHISADNRRSVQRVDISPFIQDMGDGTDTRRYSSSAADPCAAQAAATMEALEVGARVLLFDESSSSSGFLSRDSRLTGLLPGAENRVLPLSARARELVDELGVSILVAGSSSVSEFIPLADTILRIDGYRVFDITQQAKELTVSTVDSATGSGPIAAVADKSRWIVPTSLDPSSGKDDEHIKAVDLKTLEFGRSVIDLSNIIQLADVHQTETIGRILYYAKMRYMDEGRPMREVLDLVDRDLSSEGLECLSRELSGKLARPRRYEIAAALNRLNSLRISHSGD